jgi:hypothetical protein
VPSNVTSRLPPTRTRPLPISMFGVEPSPVMPCTYALRGLDDPPTAATAAVPATAAPAAG